MLLARPVDPASRHPPARVRWSRGRASPLAQAEKEDTERGVKIYICICVCVCVCVCVCLFVCASVCVCVCLYLCVIIFIYSSSILTIHAPIFWYDDNDGIIQYRHRYRYRYISLSLSHRPARARWSRGRASRPAQADDADTGGGVKRERCRLPP